MLTPQFRFVARARWECAWLASIQPGNASTDRYTTNDDVGDSLLTLFARDPMPRSASCRSR